MKMRAKLGLFMCVALGVAFAPQLAESTPVLLTVNTNSTSASAASSGTFTPSVTNNQGIGQGIGDYVYSFTITGGTAGSITVTGVSNATNSLFNQTPSEGSTTLDTGAGYFVTDSLIGGTTLASAATKNLFNLNFTTSANASGVFTINVNTTDPTFASEVDDTSANPISTLFNGGTITIVPAPEPASGAVVLIGATLLTLRRRRRAVTV